MSSLTQYFGKHSWNLSRVVYLLLGVFFIANAVLEGDWAVGVFGSWLFLMGLFRVGCAAGSCDYNPPSS